MYMYIHLIIIVNWKKNPYDKHYIFKNQKKIK